MNELARRAHYIATRLSLLAEMKTSLCCTYIQRSLLAHHVYATIAAISCCQHGHSCENKYLYHRTHLCGSQLANAPRNQILNFSQRLAFSICRLRSLPVALVVAGSNPAMAVLLFFSFCLSSQEGNLPASSLCLTELFKSCSLCQLSATVFEA